MIHEFTAVFGIGARFIAVGVLTAAAIWDAHTMTIPNRLSVAGFAAVVGTTLVFGDWAAAAIAFASGVTAVAVMAALAVGCGGLGWGDVKVSAAVAAGFGMPVFTIGMAIAAALGLTWARYATARSPVLGPTPAVAFAPLMAIGVLVANAIIPRVGT